MKMADAKKIVSSPDPLIPIPTFQTLPEYLLSRARQHSENGESYYSIDATSKEKRYFNQFDSESKKIAGALYDLGLRKGDVVIYLPSEMIKLHIFLTGVWRANGICRASYPDDDSDTLADRIKETKCKIVLCDTGVVGKIKEATKNVEWSVEIITTEDYPECLSIPDILKRNDEKSCPPLELKGDDPALILCTSGTTGPPKGALLTHSTIVQHLHYITYLPFSDDKPNVMFSTATHYSGSLLTLALLACGKTSIVTGKVTKELLWETIRSMKPGNAFAFPTYLMSLVSPEAKDFDFSSLDYLMTGGGMVTPAIKGALLQLPNVKDIVVMYGLSECGITVANAVYRENPSAKRTYEDLPDFSVGKPTPGTLIQIRDVETLEPLGPNQRGEICIRNPWLFHSYLNNPEATEKTYIDGYLRTGDIGYYCERGFIYVVDRLKEIFKYYNNHISPSELENVIGQHPLVDEVCVIGVPDPGGDVPRAFVTIKGTQSSTTIQEITEFSNSKLPSYKHLRGGLYVVPELPKGKTGKITRNLVAKIQV